MLSHKIRVIPYNLNSPHENLLSANHSGIFRYKKVRRLAIAIGLLGGERRWGSSNSPPADEGKIAFRLIKIKYGQKNFTIKTESVFENEI